MKRSVLAVALLTALMLSAWTLPGRADSDDHERARQALEAGEVLPLRTVLDRIEPDYPGQVMEVELEREDGVWVYDIKLLRAGGILVKLEVDARDGSVLGVKRRDRGKH